MSEPATTNNEAASALARLRRDYPDWEIFSNRVWMALSRPTQTSEHILWARDLDGLRAKLVAIPRS